MHSIAGLDSWQIADDWYSFLKEDFLTKSFELTQARVESDYQVQELTKVKVLPSKDRIFYAFNLCPLESIKVIILGQDPYPNEKDASGLAFSSESPMRPSSLRNIFIELLSDLNLPSSTTIKTNNLSSWASQGVLLLNSVLTYCPSAKGNSHSKLSWQLFTDSIIRKLSLYKDHLVFILWGNFAKEKNSLIENKENHLILESPHPSPFSARLGFFGSKPFSKTNAFLRSKNIEEIDWLRGLV